MEKNTLLAIVLSVVVISGFFLIQSFFFPPQQPARAARIEQSPVSEPAVVSESPEPSVKTQDAFIGETDVVGENTRTGAETGLTPAQAPSVEQRVTVDTNLIKVTLSSAGGDVVSWQLKEHNYEDSPVEMVLSGDKEAHAFTLAFGGLNAQPVTSYFHVRRPSEYTVEFYRDFAVPAQNGYFTLIKRYDFKPNEYMFELTISLNGGYSVSGFDFNGAAYTLSFGPQIGPKFAKLDQRYEYRNYYTYVNGKRRQDKINDNNPVIISSRPTWAAIAGKYFALIAIPYLAQYDLNFSAKSEPGLAAASRLSIIRPALKTSRADDTYRFYLGPKTQDVLTIYNNGGNSFNLQDMQLIEVANSKDFLAPLEKVLKWFLLLFYKLIPNYGVAIILLTLLVKVLFFPLTKKGSESTLRMQALSPKIKEIQEKYKDNPQKMNAEMAEFYKKEGYNPVSGCLPMLLQIPIFFAMYNLFNNHFDLRGAMFIPGWIPDLSLPESIFNFSPVTIPILGWSDIRLLPFIYVASQLLYGKVTQTPDQQGNSQMKMMLYVMPVVFFFILYDVPSGLLLYWIMSNLLTMVQQVSINKYLAPKRAAQAAADAAAKQAAVIAPKKKKKK
jgi:YidC/Oxa1 family membrane protein insertase